MNKVIHFRQKNKKRKMVNYFVNEWNYWSTTHIYAYASVENARVTITAHRCVNTYAYTTANISIIFKHQSKITFHETSRHDHAFYLDTHKHSVTACGWAFLHNHIDFVYGTVNAHIQCMSACYKIHKKHVVWIQIHESRKKVRIGPHGQ